MRIYEVESYDRDYFVVKANGRPCHQLFENAKYAWKHAEKLAKLYARIKNLTATYTTHPDGGAKAAWVVK